MEAFSGAAIGTSFPVIFFDGEQETSLGNVSVSSRFNLKQFQSAVAEKLGLSPHQFSIYLTDRKNHSSRTTVTEKMNFAAVSRKDCVFLIVLKQLRRRERKRKTRETAEIIRDRSDPPPNLMLLRRDGNKIAINGGGFPGVDLDRSFFERRISALRMERERYLMNLGLAFESLSLKPERTDATVVCHECLRAKEMGRDSGFHWCVYDTVTFGFRSPAGPISRPAKGAGGREASPTLASWLFR